MSDRHIEGELTGGCLCGAVRYRLTDSFRLLPYACHCTDCQKRTGSAFSEHMLVSEGDIHIEGELDSGTFTSPSGTQSKIYGCAVCKARIYATNDERAGMASLRWGTLDDSADFSPAVHIWVKSKQSWIVLPEGVPQMETQPQSSKGWMEILSRMQ